MFFWVDFSTVLRKFLAQQQVCFLSHSQQHIQINTPQRVSLAKTIGEKQSDDIIGVAQ